MISNRDIFQRAMPIEFFRLVLSATTKVMQVTNFRSEVLVFDQIENECSFSGPKK